MTPSLRRLPLLSALVFVSLVAALALRAPRPVEDVSDLRDSVGDHALLLSAGHASFSCGTCHIAHPAKAQRPLWQKQAAADPSLFVRESAAAGGVKTGMCMSCHDGTVAGTIKAHAVTASAGGMDLGANHPVGGDYMDAVRRDPVSFNHPASNTRIVLEDGKVGCISCHAAHDNSAGSVRPEVCIDCHRR